MFAVDNLELKAQREHKEAEDAPSHEVSIWKVYCLSLSFDVDMFLIPPHLILILYVLYIA
jgi:hypothetical protein